MLKFEFMQHTEFSNPEYYVTDEDDGEYVGIIYFFDGMWNYMSRTSWGLSSGYINDIANKLATLDEDTKQQRILGVF